jgi:hypothetical protein
VKILGRVSGKDQVGIFFLGALFIARFLYRAFS